MSRVEPRPGRKGHFVPGGGFTRDKRLFCPGSWLHPGQKAPTPISPFFLPLPQHLVVFLICVAPLSSPAPTAPPARRRRRPRAPPTSAARAPPPHRAIGAELRRPRAPSTSPTSAARPSSIRRPSAVGPPPRRRSAPLESPVRFAAMSSTLCVPPLARSGPASVAPAVVCLDTAAPTPARRRLRLDVAAPLPRRYSTRRHASTPTPRRRPCPRRGMGRPPAISFFLLL